MPFLWDPEKNDKICSGPTLHITKQLIPARGKKERCTESLLFYPSLNSDRLRNFGLNLVLQLALVRFGKPFKLPTLKRFLGFLKTKRKEMCKEYES